MGIVSDHDLEIAREIPKEYLGFTGIPHDRVIDLVERRWPSFGSRSRAELVQALLPVLVDMENQGRQSLAVYQGLCEGIVATWILRQRDSETRAG